MTRARARQLADWSSQPSSVRRGVTVSFVIAGKIERARTCVPAAYVFRVKAGRG